jgi:pimeloyl-ACP methyl ester carboxylesterase
VLLAGGLLLAAPCAAQQANRHLNQPCSSVSTLASERSHFTQKFVEVGAGVKLEVLDWGGHGRPLVLLAGLGNTAHVFDNIAPKLAEHFHVYGITRRGFGASSVPKTGYTPERLAQDVATVLRKLNIRKPIVVGHSIAGEELSEIGLLYPDRISGLVYLDAVHDYSVYDPNRGSYVPDLNRLKQQIERMKKDPFSNQQMAALLRDATDLTRSLGNEIAAIKTDDASTAGATDTGPTKADLASFAAFRCFVSRQLGGLMPEDEVRQTFSATATGGVGDQKAPDFVGNAILGGEERLEAPALPILAIVPVPRASDLPRGTDPAKIAAAEAMHTRMQEADIAALKRQQPSAEVVRIPGAHHYVFLSDQPKVVDAIERFGHSLH